jgi:hypothetical protein
MTELSSSLPARVRIMQIIAGALLLGVLSFLAVVLFIRSQQANAPPDIPIISLVGVAVLVSNIATALFVPPLVLQGGLRRLAGSRKPSRGGEADTSGLLVLRQTTLILVLALLEGAAFLGIIAYLLEGSAIGLGVAGVAVLVMLFHFPTEDRVRSWVRQQEQRLTNMRLEASAGSRPGGTRL